MLNQHHTTQTQTISKYRVIRTLGSGLFKVKLVFDPVSSRHYAAKICKYSLKKTILEREATLLRELTDANIPNIVQYIDYVDITKVNNQINYTSMTSLQNFPELNTAYESALIIEYAPNDTLFDIIYHTGKLEPKLARTYFKKLVETVSTLHSKGYVHRDLKPENLLLDQNFQLKLADFGFARSFSSYNKDRMTTKLGTEAYMAPEMLASRTYSGTKVDSFACGVLLFLFSFGRPPFYNASSGDTLYKNFIQESPEKFWEVYEEKLNDGKEYDKDLKVLISDLIKYNPKERLEIGKAEDYEWLKGEVYRDEELVKIMEPLKAAADQGIKNLKK